MRITSKHVIIAIASTASIATSVVIARWFAPPPPLVVSKDTTFLTSPLASDGAPDYVLAMVERSKDGVTPENNGARLFWQAIGPANVTAHEHELICRELQVEKVTLPFLADVNSDEVIRRMALWLRSRKGEPEGLDAMAEPTDEEFVEAESWLSAALSHPWTSNEAPPLEAWLAENDATLDLIVASMKQPRFYSPPPNWLADKNTSVLDLTLPLLSNARSAVRSLSARAMNRIARKQYDAAWSDIQACWRLGAHIGNDPTLVGKMVGIAVRGVAVDATLALLQLEDLPTPSAEQILRNLQAQPTSLDIHHALDNAERFSFLDAALRMATGRMGGIDMGGEGEKFPVARNIDPNIMLRSGNVWYDRIASLAELSPPERQREFDRYQQDLDELGLGVKKKMLLSLVSNIKRSEAMAEVLICLTLPATEAALRASDRDEAKLSLVQLAAALAVYKSRHGIYPSVLSELAPEILAAIPVDHFDGKRPPRFELRGEGYLLYSVYVNGRDDGGRNIDGRIDRGEWLQQDEPPYVSPDEADLVIRLPRPRTNATQAAQSP